MSGSISNPGSVFVTAPQAQVATHTIAEGYAVNGITDVSLSDQFRDASNKGQQRTLDFLNNLTPSQLSEKTLFSFESGGGRVATFATVKEYVNLLDGLQKVSESFSGGTGRLESSDATQQDFERQYVQNLSYKVQFNVPGAADEVRSYLASKRDHDTITFSVSAFEKSQQLLENYVQSAGQNNWSSSANPANLAVLEASLGKVGSEELKVVSGGIGQPGSSDAGTTYLASRKNQEIIPSSTDRLSADGSGTALAVLEQASGSATNQGLKVASHQGSNIDLKV